MIYAHITRTGNTYQIVQAGGSRLVATVSKQPKPQPSQIILAGRYAVDQRTDFALISAVAFDLANVFDYGSLSGNQIIRAGANVFVLDYNGGKREGHIIGLISEEVARVRLNGGNEIACTWDTLSF